jgi:hypothetical protein
MSAALLDNKTLVLLARAHLNTSDGLQYALQMVNVFKL